MNSPGQVQHPYIQLGVHVSELDDLLAISPYHYGVASRPLDRNGFDQPSEVFEGKVVAFFPGGRRPRKELGDLVFEADLDLSHGGRTVLGCDEKYI